MYIYVWTMGIILITHNLFVYLSLFSDIMSNGCTFPVGFILISFFISNGALLYLMVLFCKTCLKSDEFKHHIWDTLPATVIKWLQNHYLWHGHCELYWQGIDSVVHYCITALLVMHYYNYILFYSMLRHCSQLI